MHNKRTKKIQNRILTLQIRSFQLCERMKGYALTNNKEYLEGSKKKLARITDEISILKLELEELLSVCQK